MGGSFTIGRVFGIDVKVHWSFFLLLAFFGYLAFGDSGSYVDALVTVGIVVALFFCVLLHEYGHALVALRLGSEVQDITLLPIGGLARMKSLPERPIDEVKIAVAGPLVNVVLAPVFFGLALLLGGNLSVPTDVLSGVG
jgi:Zn-dependent protease